MNKCIFIGRLTKDPEVTYSEKNKMAIARFAVAVDRIPKKEGEPEADFFNCVAFDKKAQFVEKYWYCGMRVAVCGKMQNDFYVKKNGEKVYGVTLRADDVEFADGKRQTQNEAASGTTVPPSGTTAPATRTAAPASIQGNAKQPANRNTAQRTAPGRSVAGRGAARAVAGDRFMNVASVVDEGLPFN